MKKMNYQTAAAKAINCFEQVRKSFKCDLIEKDAEFRKLTVMESCGRSNELYYVLFEIEFCDKDGGNYRVVWIRVRLNEELGNITAALDERTIKEIK